jgi:hypothetical protein
LKDDQAAVVFVDGADVVVVVVVVMPFFKND